MTQAYEPTLAEYTTRQTRYNLVQLCLGTIQDKQGRHSKPEAATKILASYLYVSQRTAQRWAKGGIQSCNVNAEAITSLALSLSPFKATEILKRDLERHHREFMATIPRGALEGEIQLIPQEATA